jgi:hypothetical protein
VFAAIGDTRVLVDAVASLIVPAVLVSFAATVAFLMLYYGVFRPRLEPAVVTLTENRRPEMGLAARLLMGGVVEEAVFRFGIMTLLAWVGAVMLGLPFNVAMSSAIIGAGALFGLGHAWRGGHRCSDDSNSGPRCRSVEWCCGSG